VKAQIEGASAFGLAAALYGRVEFAGGAAAVSNFHEYPLLRIDEMPRVEVSFVNGDTGAPAGVGEIGVPPLAPAVCNALAAATGRRVRSLPLHYKV
jgi:isoquinoline 1-oxidoreductase beta subunit